MFSGSGSFRFHIFSKSFLSRLWSIELDVFGNVFSNPWENNLHGNDIYIDYNGRLLWGSFALSISSGSLAGPPFSCSGYMGGRHVPVTILPMSRNSSWTFPLALSVDCSDLFLSDNSSIRKVDNTTICSKIFRERLYRSMHSVVSIEASPWIDCPHFTMHTGDSYILILFSYLAFLSFFYIIST